MTVLLDPTGEQQLARRTAAPRPQSLHGKRVGLLDIAKPRGNVFLDEVARELRELGAEVERFSKPTFTKPAPVDLRHEIASKCDVVIEALAD